MPQSAGARGAVVVLMGPSGAGKSTVGELLAGRLDWEFVDADDYHPEANVEKMRQGISLDDTDREPWLEALREAIDVWLGEGRNVVLACSALKQAYREKLSAGSSVMFIYLKGDYDMFEERLRERKGHFAAQKILPDQFADLEEPGPGERAVTVHAGQSPQEIVDEVVRVLLTEGLLQA